MIAPARDEEALLRAALDPVGLRYEIRGNADGRPFAVFAMVTPAALQLPTSVTVLGQALRITLHQLIAGPPYDNDLWLFEDVNQSWSFGRIYYSYDAASYEAAAGLDLANAAPSREAMHYTLNHLADAAASLRNYRTPEFQAPAAARPVSVADVAAVLAGLGLGHREEHEGRILAVGISEPDGHSFHIQLFVLPGSLLVVRGQHGPSRVTPENGETLRKLQQLNQRLGIGTACYLRGSGRVYYQIVIPLAWTPLDADLLRRVIDQTRIVMARIHEQF